MILQNVYIETDYIYADNQVVGSRLQHVAIEINEGKIFAIHNAPFYEDGDQWVDGNGQLVLPKIYNLELDLSKELEKQHRLKGINHKVDILDLELNNGTRSIKSSVNYKNLKKLQKHIYDYKGKLDLSLDIYTDDNTSDDVIIHEILSDKKHNLKVMNTILNEDNYKDILGQTFKLADEYSVNINVEFPDDDVVLSTNILLETIELVKGYDMKNVVTLHNTNFLSYMETDVLYDIYRDLITWNISIISQLTLVNETLPPLELFRLMGGELYLGSNNGNVLTKLIEYVNYFEIRDYLQLSKCLGLITWNVTPIKDKRNVWPNVNDEASFTLTYAQSSSEFIIGGCEVSNIIYKGVIQSN